MTSPHRTAGVLVAALVAGLCFQPVFGTVALLRPLGALCIVAFAIDWLCNSRRQLLPWRPLLVAGSGLVAVIETTLWSTTKVGLPTPATMSALVRGLDSWQLTLESTWPARPSPDLVLFVPLLVLIACVLGLELLHRERPLAATLPSLVVLGISQAYSALHGWSAVMVAVAFAGAVAAMLAPSYQSPGRKGRTRSLAPLVAVAVVAVAGLLGGLVLAAVDPAERTPYSLQQGQSADLPTSWPTNPLDEIAARLSDPDKPVLRYRSAEPVGPWRLVALDDFDGANWSTSHPFLRLGAELEPGLGVRVPLIRQQASVELTDLTGPWLPSQLLPASVNGPVEPQVEPVGSTLLAADRPGSYTITWSKPVVDASRLLRAGLDPDAPGGLGDLGAVPPEIASIAETALRGRRPTFQTALALERYLGQNYALATGTPLPTGHSWPQLQQFLVDTKTGTSEQFAAAYVVLARQSGIPARLVVGFQAPAQPGPDGWYTVRNAEVLAWPEVAVDGVGWWPLDPAGQADKGRPVVPGGATDVTEHAREELPPSNELQDPELPAEPANSAADSAGDGPDLPVQAVLLVLVGGAACWLIGVPLAKVVRAQRRRRRTGSAAVVGAWAEARDKLRAYGVPVTAGMTVRDLSEASAAVTDEQGRTGLSKVARAVDDALWSGSPAGGDLSKEAWAGVRELRDALNAKGWGDRLRAALEVRTLLRP